MAEEPLDRKQLVTDLTNDLNPDEIDLLTKGPNFSLSTGVNNDTISELNIKFCRLANRIRWNKTFQPNNQPTTLAAYPQSKHISKPTCSPELEQKLKRIHHNYQHVVNSIKPRAGWSNLTTKEKLAIKSLKDKHNIYLPSDKGSEFCIIDQSIYHECAINHLNKPILYIRKLRECQPKP